ncbi:MAG: response regulator [Chitinophagales bacterium]
MSNSVLAVDDDRFIQKIIQDSLEAEGIKVFTAKNCRQAELILQKDLPDLILLDVIMPDMDGFDFLRQIRNNTRTSHLPVILLTSKADINDKVQGLDLGADDYITKPFETLELIARVKTHIRRAKQINYYNPLTGLPGNVLIEERLDILLSKQAPFSVCYVDLDNFKAYNDAYGFLKGDEVIKMVAHILKVATEKYGSAEDFVGHIGGDDYVFFTLLEKVDTVCQEIIDMFDGSIPLFFDAQDRQRGFIIGTDRDGNTREIPIMTISIAVVDCKNNAFKDGFQVSEIAALTKKVAKELPHSNYIRYTGGQSR